MKEVVIIAAVHPSMDACRKVAERMRKVYELPEVALTLRVLSKRPKSASIT